MKKIIITLITLLMPFTVYALSEDNCKNLYSIYKDELSNFSYTLEKGEYLDMNGDKVPGYYLLRYSGLGENIELDLVTDSGFYSSKNNEVFMLNGGVYKMEFYVNECENPFMTYDIKVPTYNEDCGKNCKNIWFDGTYETILDDNEDNKTTIDKKLLIVLISLIVIILFITFGLKYIRNGGIKMKKITIILFAFLSFAISVNASVDETNGACDPSNPYYNPLDWVGNQTSPGSGLVYEISHTDFKDNSYNLYGYALFTNVNNVMDKEGTAPTSNYGITSIEIRAAKTESDLNNEEKYIPLNIEYLHGDNGSNLDSGAHYFNVAYWNCFRHSNSDRSNPNKCFDTNAKYIQGGFNASLDLEDEKFESGTYYLFFKVTSTVSGAANTGWKKLAVADIVASNETKNAGKTLDVNGTTFKIKSNSTKAKIKVSEGRLMGKSGFFCDSPATGVKSRAYFRNGTTYDIYGDLVTTYRGNNEGAFYNHIYPLQVSTGTVNLSAAGGGLDGSVAYAPSSWLEFEGNIQIEIKKNKCDPKECCYTKEDDDTYKYHADFDGKDSDEEELYKCNATVEEGKEDECPSDKIVACREKVKCPPDACCFSRSGEYDEDAIGDEESNYKCTEAVEEGEDCPSDKLESCAPEDDCSDEVSSATCTAGGVEGAYFNEKQNKFKSCTLNKNEDSGFIFLDSNYCTAGCADTLSIDQPGTKTSKSGSYFSLDQYTPHIETTRICVGKVDVSTFKSDLQEAEAKMIEAYNKLQDYKSYLENLPASSNRQEGTKHEYGSYALTTSVVCPYVTIEDWYSKGQYDCNRYGGNVYQTEDVYCAYPSPGVCTSQYKKVKYSTPLSCTPYTVSWQATNPSFTPANGTYDALFSITSGNYGTEANGEAGCTKFGDEAKEDLDAIKRQANAKVSEYNTQYTAALAQYNKIQKEYNDCSKWYKESSSYNYTGNPDEDFNYKDMDGGNYSTVVGTMKKTSNIEVTDVSFWEEETGPDEETYEGGSPSSSSKTEQIFIVKCTGKTCGNESSSTPTGSKQSFDINGYIRKDYKGTFDYSLPQIYTLIPTGTIVTNQTENSLILPQNAVPIHLRTPAKEDEYTLTLSNVIASDDLRTKAIGNDNYLERLFGRAESDGIFGSDGEVFKCTYNVINDIYVPDRINFFYRVVDMNNINPVPRELGYNWTDAKGEEVQGRMKQSAADYQALREGSDKFSFRLTPKAMSAIRDYNALRSSKQGGAVSSDGNGYADWTLTCEDNSKEDYYCTSKFLTCLASSGGNCVNIMPGDIANSLNIDYNYYTSGSLDTNRAILREKLKSLG